MLHRRAALLGGLAAVTAGGLAAPRLGFAADTTGITATEIKVGNTAAYSGPASAYGTIARSQAAAFRMVNEQGGIAGRKINFISYDDGYSPPKAVEQTRRLVEQDKVACSFNQLGTPSNSAIVRYLNQRKVPHLFVGTGADKWGNYQDTPWTIGWQPSYRTEAQIYAKHMQGEKPNARIAILYQNDDFGKDYLIGLKEALGAQAYEQRVRAVSHEVTDATVDSQILTLQGSGAEVLLTATTPKFAAQTIRRVHDIGWRPLHYLSNVSISAGTVMNPAGPEKGVGIITSAYLKDPTDPSWKDDPGMNQWRDFMRRWFPEGDLTDASNIYGYGLALTLLQVLRQCGANLSRESLMKEAANIADLELPVLLPGVRVRTSPTNFHPIKQMQLTRWNGTTWERFGGILEGGAATG